jgi:hypothetical protein
LRRSRHLRRSNNRSNVNLSKIPVAVAISVGLIIRVSVATMVEQTSNGTIDVVRRVERAGITTEANITSVSLRGQRSVTMNALRLKLPGQRRVE